MGAEPDDRPSGFGIEPRDAVLPGRWDARLILACWYARKSKFWVFGLGLLVAVLAFEVREVDATATTPGDVLDELQSPLAGIAIALLLHFGSSLVALFAAIPIARRYDAGLEPRAGFGRRLGTALDRFKVMRAYRSLRWTHHVRQVAIERLDPERKRLPPIDTALDVANIVLLAAGLIALTIVGGSAA